MPLHVAADLAATPEEAVRRLIAAGAVRSQRIGSVQYVDLGDVDRAAGGG